MPNGSTIYIVEDDAALRDSLQVLLETHQFAVSAHPNGEELLAAYARGPRLGRECLLLDADPAGFGAFDFEQLAGRGFAGPVVVMTGRDPDAVAGELGRVPVFALVEKPFVSGWLLAVICQALADGGRSRPH